MAFARDGRPSHQSRGTQVSSGLAATEDHDRDHHFIVRFLIQNVCVIILVGLKKKNKPSCHLWVTLDVREETGSLTRWPQLWRMMLPSYPSGLALWVEHSRLGVQGQGRSPHAVSSPTIWGTDACTESEQVSEMCMTVYRSLIYLLFSS